MTRPTVTVILPTCNRPCMLGDALESVRCQTARASIARVVVSENSENGESRDVCSRFADLPIHYVQQRPPVPALVHFKAIWPLIETPVAAILHDDDWWAAAHVDAALDALVADPRSVAVYSAFLESYGPKGFSWPSQCFYFAWLAAGHNNLEPVAFLDPPAVMLACLLNTSLHYSTLVGKTEVLFDGFSRNLSRRNSFDNDRTFPMFASMHGLIGYVQTPSAFVRNHLRRDSWSAENLGRGHMSMARETTRWLLQNYPREVSIAADRFKSAASSLDSLSVRGLWHVLRAGTHEPQWSTLVRECGVPLSALKRATDTAIVPLWLSTLFDSTCPPVLNRWIRLHIWERVLIMKQARSRDRADIR